MHHRQQVVAGGHARAALVNDLGGRLSADQRFEFGAQQGSGLEASVGGEVVLEAAVQRARDVAGHRIERFDIAAKAFGSTCVDNTQPAEPGRDLIGIDRDLQRAVRRTGRCGRVAVGGGVGASVVAPPASVQARRPPSSTVTSA